MVSAVGYRFFLIVNRLVDSYLLCFLEYEFEVIPELWLVTFAFSAYVRNLV